MEIKCSGSILYTTYSKNKELLLNKYNNKI